MRLDCVFIKFVTRENSFPTTRVAQNRLTDRLIFPLAGQIERIRAYASPQGKINRSANRKKIEKNPAFPRRREHGCPQV